MALIVSAASGNFNAGATWVGGVVPGVGDEARASNGHTITIDVDTTCDEVSNAGTGIFTLASGVTLTANVTNKSTTTSRNCLQFTAASPAVGTIVGNVTGGTVSTAIAVNNTSSGSIQITGNVTAGSGAAGYGAQNTSTGSITVTGNVSGGASSGIFNPSTGSITVTGNATGGTGTNSAGVWNASTGVVTINGIATGGTGATSFGVNNVSTGNIFVTRAKGNAFGPGNTVGLSAVPGANNVTTGIIEVQELEFGQYGMSPVLGTGIRLKKVSTNQAIFNYVDAGAAKTLVDATQGEMPAVTDVRSGVSYASGALTGTCAVPAASSVGFGVPVDNTTGTAYLSQSDVLAAVWGAATTSLTTAGSIGERLKNCSTVESNGAALATALTAP